MRRAMSSAEARNGRSRHRRTADRPSSDRAIAFGCRTPRAQATPGAVVLPLAGSTPRVGTFAELPRGRAAGSDGAQAWAAHAQCRSSRRAASAAPARSRRARRRSRVRCARPPASVAQPAGRGSPNRPASAARRGAGGGAAPGGRRCRRAVRRTAGQARRTRQSGAGQSVWAAAWVSAPAARGRLLALGMRRSAWSSARRDSASASAPCRA